MPTIESGSSPALNGSWRVAAVDRDHLPIKLICRLVWSGVHFLAVAVRVEPIQGADPLRGPYRPACFDMAPELLHRLRFCGDPCDMEACAIGEHDGMWLVFAEPATRSLQKAPPDPHDLTGVPEPTHIPTRQNGYSLNWRHGVRAARIGLPAAACPHEQGRGTGGQRRAWLDGHSWETKRAASG